MNFIIRGENIEVTPAIREYVEKKVAKLKRYYDVIINGKDESFNSTYSKAWFLHSFY